MSIPGRQQGDENEIFHDYIKDFRPEHRLSWTTLQSIPISSLEWSTLCPSMMLQRSQEITYPPITTHNGNEIVLGSTYPPLFELGNKGEIPPMMKARLPDNEMGREIAALVVGGTAYMEDIADRLAEELDNPTGDFIGKKVGLKHVPGTKQKVV